MPEDTVHTSGSYRIELLNADNWMPWKRRMLAVLRDLELDTYIEKDACPPIQKDPSKSMKEEDERRAKWYRNDAKARTRIELAIGDAEMVHIIGAMTASEMWNQLTTVKEARGDLGVLATRRALYRTVADDSFEMADHISKLRRYQEELHIMGSHVADEEFAIILISSLPDSWDVFTSAYLATKADSTSKPLTSHELIAILLEEFRRRKGRSEGNQNVAMQGKFKKKHDDKKKGPADGKKCYNCSKLGHFSRDCRSKKKGKDRHDCEDGCSTANKTNQASQVNGALEERAYMAGKPSRSPDELFLDSGTTSHIHPLKDAFVKYKSEQSTVQGVAEQHAKVAGIGDIVIDYKINGEVLTHRLLNVLHVPEALNELVSVGRFIESGGSVTFQNGKCKLHSPDKKLVGTGEAVGKLFRLDAKVRMPSNEKSNLAKSKKLSWTSWHRRYGHLGPSGLENLKKKNLVLGLDVDENSELHSTCEACVQAKQTTRPYPKEAKTRSTIPGERTMGDVWGPARTASITGSKYYLAFTDDATRHCTVYFLKTKDEAARKIQEYVAAIENKFDRKSKKIRFDNGKELVNKEIKKWAGEKGITIETTAPYAHSQNGVAERFNRTLLELARAMLIANELPIFLWPEAVAHAVYIRNRSPTKALADKTPHEAWTGEKPNVSHFREFGCDIWVLREGENVSKLAPRSKRMKFMGFEDGQRAVRYYDPEKRSIKVSRNIVFNENTRESGDNVDLPNISKEGEKLDKETLSENEDSPPKMATEKPNLENDTGTDAGPRRMVTRSIRVDYEKLNDPLLNPRKPRPSISVRSQPENETEEPTTHESYIAYAFASIVAEEIGLAEKDPANIREAENAPDWEEWKKAMDDEINQLNERKTWKLVDLPPDRSAIGNKWVFVRKRDENGAIISHKARLVAQGCSQKPGVDFNETFVPIMRLETLRTRLAIAAIEDFEILQLDVKGAYLNGDLQEEIYMRQPIGFEDRTHRVCRLEKSLYGLKQAGNVWNRELDGTLRKIGYARLRTDYGSYHQQNDNDRSDVLIWVDDITAFAKKSKTNRVLANQLKERYEIKEMGEPTLLLGIQVVRNRKKKTISLSQSRYVRKILQKTGMTDCKPVTTPMDPNVKLPEVTGDNCENSRSLEYATRIGELLYLAHGTRPDILFAVVKLAQYTQNPGEMHWTAIKRIYRYLKGTEDYQLVYGGEEIDLQRYADADWASDLSRKSISGYVFTIAGGAVTWSSKKQPRVALSTPEAKYVAATQAVKQLLWHRNLFQELDLPHENPAILRTDNQAAISISKNPEFHAQTKHFDIDLHFLRDHVETGTLKLEYVPSKENLADIFTKPLPR